MLYVHFLCMCTHFFVLFFVVLSSVFVCLSPKFYFLCFLRQSESSSSSIVSTMLVTQDYVAVKEDEISVVQGEVVQILASNQQNMFLVYRAANEHCPAAEGWIPGYVLGHTSSSVTPELPEGTIK